MAMPGIARSYLSLAIARMSSHAITCHDRMPPHAEPHRLPQQCLVAKWPHPARRLRAPCSRCCCQYKTRSNKENPGLLLLGVLRPAILPLHCNSTLAAAPLQQLLLCCMLAQLGPCRCHAAAQRQLHNSSQRICLQADRAKASLANPMPAAAGSCLLARGSSHTAAYGWSSSRAHCRPVAVPCGTGTWRGGHVRGLDGGWVWEQTAMPLLRLRLAGKAAAAAGLATCCWRCCCHAPSWLS
jgi:hypothetical protein